MYLPGIGIYIIVAWLAGEAVARLRLPKIVPVAAGAVALVALLLITRTQIGYWKDSESLFKHALDVTRNNYVMYNNYGELLRSKGRLDEAIENVRQALALNPGWIDAHEKLANVLQEKGLYAEAIPEFELVLRARPDKIRARNGYGLTLVKLKQYDRALEQFNIVLTADPGQVSALNNLYDAGVESGKPDKALDIILALQKKNPDNYLFCEKAGLLYGITGNIDAAIEQLEKSCRLSDYKVAEPMAFLSQAYATKRDMKHAIETAQKAIEAAQKENRDDIVTQLKASLESYQRALKERQ
jgi:protein O-mannosyl-transferase